MTKIPKKPLFSSPQFHIVCLVFPLIGLFTFAAILNPSYFFNIAIGLIAILVYLTPLRSQLIKKQAEIDLRAQDFLERTNLVGAEIRQEEEVINSYREKILNSSQLKVLTERLSLCLTLDDASRILSQEVNRLFGEDDVTIILYLFQSKTGELGISSSQKGQMRINLKSKKGDEFDQWVAKTMQPLFIENTKSDYRFDVDQIKTERLIRSLISAPLMVGNKALGILRVDSPQENHFTTEDLRFLSTVGDLGALAIENAQLYERVEQLAIKDGLTDLYLRRYLLERLPTEISRQMRRKNQLSFMMIDLDKFKQYNDKFGHVAGDIVLRTVGTALLNFFKLPGNLVCRYGGEEFCVLLPDCSKVKAVEMADTIRKKIAAETILLRREETSITISVGVATFPKDAQSKEDLISKADQALYKAKSEGRNRVVAF